MNTYRELVYMVLDQLKGMSDDFDFTEDHVIFLLSKFRGYLLKQKYADIRKEIPDIDYQTICLDLQEVPAISGEPCEGGSYLRSVQKIPYTMVIGNPMVYPIDFYQGEITFVSRQRMRYVGYNRYLQNIIYCSIGPDGYLYFKSMNPQFLELCKVKFTAIFQDTEEASDLECDDSKECDILDRNFPLEEAMIPTVIEMSVKELSGSIYKPDDSANNANDDLAKLGVTSSKQQNSSNDSNE